MSKLTVIILAKNEEQNIVDCINSAKFADEVLIIDDFSPNCNNKLNTRRTFMQ